jgi:hypothetical protein
MKRQTKFDSAEQQQHAAGQQTQQQSALEFAAAEELLRYDAEHTAVPGSIAQRLQESTGSLPPPPARSWWRRLFRRGNP